MAIEAGHRPGASEQPARRPLAESAEPASRWAPLTRREREVAALIALGRSNRQIGLALVITEGTVANHVRRVLLRLSFDCRAQVAAWVASDERRWKDCAELPAERGG